jgi:hypothetical protein
MWIKFLDTILPLPQTFYLLPCRRCVTPTEVAVIGSFLIVGVNSNFFFPSKI